MKKLIIISVLQVVFLCSFAQVHFSIRGTLKDDTVSVKNTIIKLWEGSVLMATAISNEQGNFVFENIPQNTYQLQVVSYFYEPFIEEIYLIQNYSFGVIPLKRLASLLKEIVIETSVEPIIMQPNGVTLNVENTPLKDFGSALDLLNYAPVVFINNTSQFEGGGLQILINGKSVNIPPEQQDNFLKSISTRNIEKIEIIDKPDASLEANKYGEVNIILKQTKGFSGDLEAKLMYYKTFFQSYDASFFFNSERFRLYVLPNVDIRTFLYQNIGFEDRGIMQIQKNSDSKYVCNTPTLTIGGDYQMTEQSNLGFLYSFYWENQKQIKFSDNYTFTAENMTNDSLINKESNQKHNYFSHTFSLFYTLTTDTLGSNFSTSIDFASNKQNGRTLYDFSFWHDKYDNIPSQIMNFKQQNYNKSYVVSYNAKYNKIFRNSSALNVGAKYSFTQWHNGWNIFTSNDSLDVDNSKSIIFNENIMALFAGYNFRYKKSYFSISLRYEHTINKYKNNNDSYATVTNWYILPTFLHNITINKNHRIYYYFTERIYRPNYFYYMESAIYDPINQTFGNSKLKPQNQYVFMLGYIMRNKYTATLQLIRNEELFLKMPELSESVLIYSTINGGNSTSIALTIGLPVIIFDWWETSTNLSLSYINRNFTKNNGKYISNNWQGNISHSSYFHLPKRISINIDYSYTSKSRTFFYSQADIHKLDAGIYWRINDDFGLGFSVSDILNSVAKNITYNYFDKITGYNNHKQITSRTFSLRFSYSFSVGKENNNYDTLESGIENQKGRLR